MTRFLDVAARQGAGVSREGVAAHMVTKVGMGTTVAMITAATTILTTGMRTMVGTAPTATAARTGHIGLKVCT